MSEKIRLLPGFDKYGINEAGDLVSFRKGGWALLSKKSPRLCIYREGKSFSISPAKYRFCVDRQIDPTSFNSKDYCISADGELITYTERSIKSHKIAKINKKDCDIIHRIKEEIEWLEACLLYYEGSPGELLLKIQDFRPLLVKLMRKRKSVPEAYAEIIEDEAEMQLLSTLDRRAIISPKRWLIKRATGLLLGREVYRIKDYDTIKQR